MTEPLEAALRHGRRVAVLLGSNIEPETNLPRAAAALARLGRVLGASQVWQTAAVGDPDQADFCNGAVLLETVLSQGDLRDSLRTIEAELGRVRDPLNKNAPRTIDLDLGFVIESFGMAVVHDPAIWERVFLAVPLAEIAPEFLAATGESLREAAARLRERDAHRLRLTLRNDLRLEAPLASAGQRRSR